MNEEHASESRLFLLYESMQFIRIMFWFFIIVGVGIIVWNFKDDLADSFGKIGKAAKKVTGAKS